MQSWSTLNSCKEIPENNLRLQNVFLGFHCNFLLLHNNCARSVCHDFKPQIYPYSLTIQSTSVLLYDLFLSLSLARFAWFEKINTSTWNVLKYALNEKLECENPFIQLLLNDQMTLHVCGPWHFNCPPCSC